MPHKYDFKEIAESVDIYAAAKWLGIKISNDRAHCPTCESDRALEFMPETNTFRCWKAAPRDPSHKCLSGDCINLYQHIKGLDGPYPAAKALWEQFLSGNVRNVHPDRDTVPATSPQKTESRTEKSQPAPKPLAPFDAEKFGKTLAYDDQVQELGISEENAALYRIGTKRGKLYIPICPPDVVPVCWAELQDGKIKLPDKWLPAANVVRFKKPA